MQGLHACSLNWEAQDAVHFLILGLRLSILRALLKSRGAQTLENDI